MSQTRLQTTRKGRRRVSNAVAALLIALFTLVVLLPLFLVLYYLLIEGLPTF